MTLVNIGCGSVFHPAWVSLDAHPANSSILRWDVRNGLPFQDKQMEACYASHLLEHLTRNAAARLLGECWRVLRPGGTVRVVVPDLEAIARHYLRLLDQSDSDDPGVEADYDWILLELFDQMVRTESGGEMYRCFTSGKVSNHAFVVARVGDEARRLMNGTSVSHENKVSSKLDWVYYWMRFREKAAIQLCTLLLGWESKPAMEHALLRHSGQLHLWMYDRFSLRRLLQKAGFVDIHRCGATESRIPAFATYDLDTDAGRVRKPDSIFMEAVKP
jgi:SAM-dependent methyltransferase